MWSKTWIKEKQIHEFEGLPDAKTSNNGLYYCKNRILPLLKIVYSQWQWLWCKQQNYSVLVQKQPGICPFMYLIGQHKLRQFKLRFYFAGLPCAVSGLLYGHSTIFRTQYIRILYELHPRLINLVPLWALLTVGPCTLSPLCPPGSSPLAHLPRKEAGFARSQDNTRSMSQQSILSGLKLWARGRTMGIQTNQRPMRNYSSMVWVWQPLREATDCLKKIAVPKKVSVDVATASLISEL